MPFDDEKEDIDVGCTLDLFLRSNNDTNQSTGSCQLIIKSTCFKSFTIFADLNDCTEQLKANIEELHGIALGDQILMQMSGEDTGQLEDGKTLMEQGVFSEAILAFDVRPDAIYYLKVQLAGSEEETHELQYKFNQTVEQLKTVAAEKVQIDPALITVLFDGRELEDDFKLYQYNICIGDTLTLKITEQ